MVQPDAKGVLTVIKIGLNDPSLTEIPDSRWLDYFWVCRVKIFSIMFQILKVIRNEYCMEPNG